MRVRIPKAAAAELAARYRARELAEQRLVDFLAGVTLTKGLRIEDVEGFNDETGELLLVRPEREAATSSPRTRRR